MKFLKKILKIEGVEKLFFFNRHIGFFFKNNYLFHFIPMNISRKFMWQNRWDSILMFSLVSSKFLAMRIYSRFLKLLQLN